MAKVGAVEVPITYPGPVTIGRALKPGSFVSLWCDGRKIGRAVVQPDGSAHFDIPDGLVGRMFRFEGIHRDA